jgi:hypothetical protein
MEADWLPKVANITHAVYVPHEGQADASLLALGVASLSVGTIHVFEVISDVLNPEQGQTLVDALTASDTVVLFGSSESKLIQRLAHCWPDYVQFSGHWSGTIIHNVGLKPAKSKTKLASLFLVIPCLTSEHRSDRPGVFRLNAEDVVGLEARGRLARTPIEVLGLQSPLGTGEVSMKDLCLLHHRDATSTKSKSLAALVDAEESLSWRDLQTILQYQPELWLIEHLRHRLDPEKYAYGLAAVNFLNGDKQHAHGVFPDIFSAVWYMERAFQPETIYRGQFRALWGLDCTLLRPLGGRPLDLAELMKRVSITERFLAEARARQDELFGTEMDEDSLLAIAQHFGFPTPLLDFTSSLRIAAFFATLGAEKLDSDESPIGVIFYQTSGLPSEERAENTSRDSKLHDLAGIRVGTLRVIRPRLTDADDRIGRQKGVFIAGYRANDLQAVGIDRVYFKQRAGLKFEDSRAGVSREQLLAENTRVSRFAFSIKASQPQSHIPPSHLIGQTKVNDSNIVGSAGARLGWHMNFGPRFLNDLDQNAKAIGIDSLAGTMNDLIGQYFSLAHVEADAHQIPNEAELGSRIEPLRDTVSTLESTVGLSDGEIWRIIRDHLPAGFEAGGHLDIRVPDNWDEAARLGLSCALFLAGWEHLRTVGGWKAQELVQTAMFRLLK